MATVNFATFTGPGALRNREGDDRLDTITFITFEGEADVQFVNFTP